MHFLYASFMLKPQDQKIIIIISFKFQMGGPLNMVFFKGRSSLSEQKDSANDAALIV